ncbi:MAG TPA: tRNA (N6-threonylcarbamoyladenosine(37)-N6)-methyltransferase TrmO [Thermofilum sp.]|nr:tRNA (N6-threonylcarbamoyladenosine(37)-N6)-methyltransferase TrmO [Thermofilum sp.]
MSFKVKPIGFVRKLESGKKYIEVLEEYEEALEKIECFSHVIVLYWLNKVPEDLRKTLRIKPKFEWAPELGIFATRFPARPNPIGITTVKLLSRRGRTLLIDDIDAEDGTPILDLKPYIPLFDKPKGRVILPRWVLRHIKEHHHEHDDLSFEEILKMVEIR